MLLISTPGLSSLPVRAALQILRGPGGLALASSWLAALGICASGRAFRLIVLDLDIDGSGRVHGLLSLRQLQPQSTLVALTHVCDLQEEHCAMGIGAAAYVGKHRSPMALERALQGLLDACPALNCLPPSKQR